MNGNLFCELLLNLTLKFILLVLFFTPNELVTREDILYIYLKLTVVYSKEYCSLQRVRCYLNCTCSHTNKCPSDEDQFKILS
jgi:hypothetical protein